MPYITVFRLMKKLIIYWICTTCVLLCSCSQPTPALRIDLPSDWTEAWLLHQRTLDSLPKTLRIDTLSPKQQQLVWNGPVNDTLEFILIPISSPIQHVSERIPHKIHLYLLPGETTRLAVKGRPEQFGYEVLEGSNLNYGVCDFINLYAPTLQQEFELNNQLFDLIKQQNLKVKIDTLVAPLQAISRYNQNLVTDYFKSHTREAVCGHVWLELPKSKAIAMETLLPHGVRNGILKQRIDQQLSCQR